MSDVILEQLKSDDREQFILDNQEAFNYGAMVEFGLRDNNFEELTPLFCELDHLTIKTRKAKLFRDKTLAKGDDICDFWIVGDKIKNPK